MHPGRACCGVDPPVAAGHNEQLLLDMVKSATGAQLSKIVRGFRRVERPPKSNDERRHVRKRHVPVDGMLCFLS